MTWNFRLVKRADSKSKRVQYGVHEVFYNDQGKPFTMTEDPVDITGESKKETREYLEMILKDISRFPVLDLRRLRWAKPPWNPGDMKDSKSFSSVKALLKDLKKRP